MTSGMCCSMMLDIDNFATPDSVKHSQSSSTQWISSYISQNLIRTARGVISLNMSSWAYITSFSSCASSCSVNGNGSACFFGRCQQRNASICSSCDYWPQKSMPTIKCKPTTPPAAAMPRRFLGESKKQISLALGNFGALGVMDALCAVMSARVRGM